MKTGILFPRISNCLAQFLFVSAIAVGVARAGLDGDKILKLLRGKTTELESLLKKTITDDMPKSHVFGVTDTEVTFKFSASKTKLTAEADNRSNGCGLVVVATSFVKADVEFERVNTFANSEFTAKACLDGDNWSKQLKVSRIGADQPDVKCKKLMIEMMDSAGFYYFDKLIKKYFDNALIKWITSLREVPITM